MNREIEASKKPNRCLYVTSIIALLFGSIFAISSWISFSRMGHTDILVIAAGIVSPHSFIHSQTAAKFFYYTANTSSCDIDGTIEDRDDRVTLKEQRLAFAFKLLDGALAEPEKKFDVEILRKEVYDTLKLDCNVDYYPNDDLNLLYIDYPPVVYSILSGDLAAYKKLVAKCPDFHSKTVKRKDGFISPYELLEALEKNEPRYALLKEFYLKQKCTKT